MSNASFDPQVVDEYANHLSKVNSTNTVLANEDIYNDHGVLLIKKGTPISEKLAQRVIKHKLVRPLEQSVNLENVVDAGRLHKLFHQLFQRYPDFLELHRALNLDGLLKEQCMAYHRYPLLTQKLTVLSMRRPKDFEKSLVCSWLALAISYNMRLPAEQLGSAFLAGLMHDIGMLHIPLEILDKKGELTAGEWRAIQSHPLIGDVFLKSVPELPREVARAALEHHERADGTGYPGGRFADRLGPVGQNVALADAICAIRLHRFATGGRTLRDLLPILQFNSALYLAESWRAAVNVLRLLPRRDGPIASDAEISGLIKQQLGIHQNLRKGFDYISIIVPLLPEENQTASMRTAAIQVQNIRFSVISSGLLSSSLGQWMQLVYKKRQAEYYVHMEEIALMHQEVQWQLRQLKKSLRVLSEEKQESDRGTAKQVEGVLGKLDELNL